MSYDYDALRERIKARIESTDGLSVRSVSLSAGASDSLLNKFLTKQTNSLKLSFLGRVADILEITLEELVAGKPLTSRLTCEEIDALAASAADEIQPSMSIAEIRSTVTAALRDRLELVLVDREEAGHEVPEKLTGKAGQPKPPTSAAV
ncbi:hypothetical protein [uncultured Novosphingobium sp.]|uniref:hypothetical protein n=1 Tax=uncultured Novosphingobium sp. TaxID=292277 RepID=UPI003747D608